MKQLSVKDLEGSYTEDLACEFIGERIARKLWIIVVIKSDGSIENSFRVIASGQAYEVDNLQEAVDIYNGKLPE